MGWNSMLSGVSFGRTVRRVSIRSAIVTTLSSLRGWLMPNDLMETLFFFTVEHTVGFECSGVDVEDVAEINTYSDELVADFG